MLKLKMAKTFPKAGSDETKKSGFFFSNDVYSNAVITRAAITHGLKQQVILEAFEKMDETTLHQQFMEFNCKAKDCKTACIIIRDYAMFYGFNHDCGFSLFNKEGKLKFQTPNNRSFGTFSSRKSYEAYITTGVIQVEKGDTVILYCGGFDQIIQSTKFYQLISGKDFEKKIDAIIAQEKERKEKTILIFTLD